MILTLGQKISKTKTKYLLKKTLSIAWIPISLIIQTKILRKQYKISKNMNSNGLLLLCLYWFLLQTLSRILNLLPWLQQWKPVFYLIWIVKQRRRKKKSVFLSPLVLTRVTHIIPVCLEVEDQRSLRKWTNCFTISTVRKLSSGLIIIIYWYS